MWDFVILIGTVGWFTTAGVAYVHVSKSRRPRSRIVAHHLDAETPRDQYGFLAMLDWAAVADLEHAMGYAHLSESKPFCGRVTCWEEDQNPEYLMENGFLTIAAFPELPREKDEFGRRIETRSELEQLEARLEHLIWHRDNPGIIIGCCIFLDRPVTEDIAELKRKVDALKPKKIVSGTINAAYMTPNEARGLGYAAPPMALETLQAQQRKKGDGPSLKQIADNIMEENYQGDSYHSREFGDIEPALKAFMNGAPMVLPEGYYVRPHSTPGMLQIDSPTGMSVVVENRTGGDRRRDDRPSDLEEEMGIDYPPFQY